MYISYYVTKKLHIEIFISLVKCFLKNSQMGQERDVRTEKMGLRDYVRRRNGVPLNAKGSLGNMLARSFGSGTFAGFWRFWNPIWGYYLGRFVYVPLARVLPRPLSLVITFLVSGLLHDIVIMALRGEWALIFVPWFGLMAVWIVLSEAIGIRYAGLSFLSRVFINALQVGLPLALVLSLQ